MGLRTAFRQMRWTTFGVLAALAWTLLVTFEVATAFQWASWPQTSFIGKAAVAGIAGVAVLGVLLGLLVTLYSELAHEKPTPQPWPLAE